MIVLKKVLLGIPVIVISKLLSDTWLSGWIACTLWIFIYELVDVRTSEEHNLFNIGGRNIPVYELEKNGSALNNGKDIVMYCSSGKRSSEAVKVMRNKFPGINIFSLEGGLKAWQEDE